jgi:hypothetical protein
MNVSMGPTPEQQRAWRLTRATVGPTDTTKRREGNTNCASGAVVVYAILLTGEGEAISAKSFVRACPSSSSTYNRHFYLQLQLLNAMPTRGVDLESPLPKQNGQARLAVDFGAIYYLHTSYSYKI